MQNPAIQRFGKSSKHKKQRTAKLANNGESTTKNESLEQKNKAKLKNAQEALKNYEPIKVPKQLQAGSIMSLMSEETKSSQEKGSDQVVLEEKSQKKPRKKMNKIKEQKNQEHGNHAEHRQEKPFSKNGNNSNSSSKFNKNKNQNNNKNFSNQNKAKKFGNNHHQKEHGQNNEASTSSHDPTESHTGYAKKFDKKRKLSPAYYEAAQLLMKLSHKKGSLNSLISECKNQNMIKLIYRLVIKVLQNQQLIRKICSKFDAISSLNYHLTEILICDYLLGKPMFTSFRKVPEIAFILGNEADIRKYYNEFKDKIQKTYASQPVRYFRINQIISDIETVVKSLKDEIKLIEKSYDKNTTTFDEFMDMAKNMKTSEFMLDYHFKDIFLILDDTTATLKNSQLYTDNSISIQDKSSLLAVEAMNLSPGMRIFDACAAPGMKSIAIASRLKNDCELFSNDMDNSRYKDMRRIMNSSGVKCAKLIHSDFTQIDPEAYQNLDVLLLDPSCTGSGMHRRIDYVKDDEDLDAKAENEKRRSLKLSTFQYKLLEKALTFKPKRLVYSTCSKHQTENEDVVEKIFINYPDLEYEVVDAFPGWPCRGIGNADFAKYCVRSDLESTLTGGFFCAVLQRKDDADPNVSAVLDASLNQSKVENVQATDFEMDDDNEDKIEDEIEEDEEQIEEDEEQIEKSPKSAVANSSSTPKSTNKQAPITPKSADKPAQATPKSASKLASATPKSAYKPAQATPKSAGKLASATPKSADKPAQATPKSAGKLASATPKSAAKPDQPTPKSASKLASATPKSAAKPDQATPKSTDKSAPVAPKSTAKPDQGTPKCVKNSPSIPKTPANTPVKTNEFVETSNLPETEEKSINSTSSKKVTPKRKSIPESEVSIKIEQSSPNKKAKTSSANDFSEQITENQQETEIKPKQRGGRTAKISVKQDNIFDESTMKTPEKVFTKFSPKMTRSRAKTVPKSKVETSTNDSTNNNNNDKQTTKKSTKNLTNQWNNVPDTPTRTLRTRSRA